MQSNPQDADLSDETQDFRFLNIFKKYPPPTCVISLVAIFLHNANPPEPTQPPSLAAAKRTSSPTAQTSKTRFSPSRGSPCTKPSSASANTPTKYTLKRRGGRQPACPRCTSRAGRISKPSAKPTAKECSGCFLRKPSTSSSVEISSAGGRRASL